jgi:DNA-binding transcriptional LysR family regulator
MTDIRNLDLNLLRAFSLLLEERSVSRTAERLHVTQPTVSGMLARLRDIFNDPLFVRTQRGLLPTPRAEALEPALRQLINDATELVSPNEFDPSSSTATLSISVNDYMQSVLVVPLIAKLRREAPHMRFCIRNLETTGLTSMLASGAIDLAVTIPEFADSSLRRQFLYREEYVSVVRKQHPLRGKQVSLKQFLAYDHVLVSPSDGAFEGPTDHALKKLGMHRRVVLSVSSFFTLIEVLQEDDLMALLPHRLLYRHSEYLHMVKAPVEVAGFDVIAAWHERTEHEPAHVWLREQLSTLAEALSIGDGAPP